MGRHARPPRRSPLEWGVRLIATGLVGWVGYLSLSQSLAVALSPRRIERAYDLAPGNGSIAALLSEKLSGPEGTLADRDRATRLARTALKNDPTAVKAVATLGMNAAIRGDHASAKRLFSYSQTLSRRDLRTQLWAIENAVASGDVAGALRHYDIALRTKKDAPHLLYPVLAGALADPQVQSELVDTLVRKPLWASSFVDYAAAGNSDPKAAAIVLQKLHRARFPVSEFASNSVISALLADKQYGAAWSLYSAVRPGAEIRKSRDARFAALIQNPSPFDWVPTSEAGISAVIQPGPHGGIFDFAAPPSVGGTLLRQLQMLPVGEYVLQGHSTGIEQPSGSRPYWTLSCHGGRELGRLEVPNSSQSGGQFTGYFTVPVGCPVQILAFNARPSSEITGATGQIDQVLLAPFR
jgi:hypothetical protein